MQTMVPLYGFGGGGGTGAALTVTAPAGCTVTVSKDGKTKTRVAGADGVAVFKGLATGTWTVTITDGEQTAQKTVTITADYAIVISFATIPEFTYTGDYEIVNDDDEPITTSQGNWKIRFLTSGTLTITNLNGAENGIDVFCVGAGGGGGAKGINFLGAGGGGYTKTEKAVSVAVNTPYSIKIGAGIAAKDGGNTTAFGITANGGKTPTSQLVGGNGGSGGGAYPNIASTRGRNGGSDGADGESGVASAHGGTGQHTTTREFGESTGKLYAGGGAGFGTDGAANGTPGEGGGAVDVSGKANTGGGGGSSVFVGGGTAGGSGIVIIRNAREVA